MTNLANLFNFISSKKPEYKTPFKAKLIYDPESITKDDLTIKGNIDFHNTKITSLPNNLTVKGEINLQNSSITSLPDNLTVGKGLILSYTKITSLPDNLTVGRYLGLYGIPITSIPNNLKVKGYLDLKNTPLSKKYSADEIRKMIEDKGGNVEENIYV